MFLKKNFDNNLKIIFSFLLFSFGAGLFLFIYEHKNRDYQYQKKWSAVYFSEPRENNLNFAIENYENEELIYSYQLLDKSGNLLQDGQLKINPGQKKEIIGKESPEGELIVEYGNKKTILRK